MKVEGLYELSLQPRCHRDLTPDLDKASGKVTKGQMATLPLPERTKS